MRTSEASPGVLKDIPFLKRVVLVNGFVPLVLLAWDGVRGQLGPNAVNGALHTTGIVSLVFLFLSLMVTPLRKLAGWNSLIQYRRLLGLFGALYAAIHFAIFVGWDRALSLASTFHELQTRRYLQVGFIALLMLAALSVTSTDGMIRRLGGKRWRMLHRLAYVATILGVVHYYMLVKADVRLPLGFGGVLAVVLLARWVKPAPSLRPAAAPVRG